MKRIVPVVLALGLLLAGSFGGVLLWSLVAQPGRAQDASVGLDFGDEFGGGFGTDFGGGLSDSVPGFREPWREVWTEVMFLLVNRADAEQVRIGDRPVISPTGETALLTPDEKVELLQKLRSKPSFQIVGATALVTVSGQQALMQCIDEVSYPLGPTQAAADSGLTVPGATGLRRVESRELGVRYNVTPTISADGKTITLVILPELSRLADWIDFGADVPGLPLFRSWNITTTVYCTDGMTFMMTGAVAGEFGAPALWRQHPPEASKTAIVLISARIISDPTEPQEEPGP